MLSAKEIQDIMNHATGTTAYHRFSQISGYPVITDEMQAVAEAAGCYWLLDVIGSHQSNQKLDPALPWNTNIKQLALLMFWEACSMNWNCIINTRDSFSRHNTFVP